MPANLTIRNMHPTDAANVAELSAELGYPATTEQIALRLAEIGNCVNESTTRGLFVADHDKLGVIGWIYVYSMQPFHADRYAEIGGLVVGAAVRRTGTGAALMRVAEAWADERGYLTMRLRSGMHRPDAHLFYAAIGYGKVRESMMFRKTLVGA